MSVDVPYNLPFAQGGDSQAVVPVASAEEQLPVVRDGEHLGRHVHPWGKGAVQVALSPGRREKVVQCRIRA